MADATGITALLALAAATAGVSLALSLGPGVAPASAACPHARAHPHHVALPKIRKAITCLINKKRSKRDRHLLEPNDRLELAARRHTRTMLAEDCFRHRCEGEPGLNRRVRRAGYTKGQRSWGFAEIIGYENTPQPDDRALDALHASTAATCSTVTSATSASGSAGELRWPVETTASSPPTRSSSAGAGPSARRMFDPRHAWRRRRLDPCPGTAEAGVEWCSGYARSCSSGRWRWLAVACSFSPGL